MTVGPTDTSSISTEMPKLMKVRLMMFAFALMSPTPGLPLSAPTVELEVYLELGKPALVHIPINRVEESDE